LSNFVKIVTVTAIIGAGIYLTDKFYRAANAFGVKLKSFGLPIVSATTVTLPLDLEFNNTTGLTISIPDFLADIYVKKNGQWIRAGVLSQAIQLAPGISQKRINPSANLRTILGGDLFQTANSILESLRARAIEIKVLATGTANGIAMREIELVPPQTITL